MGTSQLYPLAFWLLSWRSYKRLKEVRYSPYCIVGICEVLLGTGAGRIDIAAGVAIHCDSDKNMLGLDLDPYNAYARPGLGCRHNWILWHLVSPQRRRSVALHELTIFCRRVRCTASVTLAFTTAARNPWRAVVSLIW